MFLSPASMSLATAAPLPLTLPQWKASVPIDTSARSSATSCCSKVERMPSPAYTYASRWAWPEASRAKDELTPSAWSAVAWMARASAAAAPSAPAAMRLCRARESLWSLSEMTGFSAMKPPRART